ncbi:MAG: hypothetical protein RML36_12860 [Anaerolineae bacterium]|nr:hypothetical protein [Anaerolineae bacterium]MDW8100363.1 hypothetical protein [Anaerolineae bacterium]
MSASSTSTKDPNTAMVIEIVAGYFGFLGIGYLYAGRTGAGLLRLFGWWAFIVAVAIGLPFLTIFTAPDDVSGLLGSGLGSVLCLLCLIPLLLAVPVISGLMLKHSMS